MAKARIQTEADKFVNISEGLAKLFGIELGRDRTLTKKQWDEIQKKIMALKSEEVGQYIEEIERLESQLEQEKEKNKEQYNTVAKEYSEKFESVKRLYTPDGLREKIQEFKTEIEKRNAELATKNSEIATKNSEISDLEKLVDDTTQELGIVKKNAEAKGEELEKLKRREEKQSDFAVALLDDNDRLSAVAEGQEVEISRLQESLNTANQERDVAQGMYKQEQTGHENDNKKNQEIINNQGNTIKKGKLKNKIMVGLVAGAIVAGSLSTFFGYQFGTAKQNEDPNNGDDININEGDNGNTGVTPGDNGNNGDINQNPSQGDNQQDEQVFTKATYENENIPNNIKTLFKNYGVELNKCIVVYDSGKATMAGYTIDGELAILETNAESVAGALVIDSTSASKATIYNQQENGVYFRVEQFKSGSMTKVYVRACKIDSEGEIKQANKTESTNLKEASNVITGLKTECFDELGTTQSLQESDAVESIENE